MDLFTYVTSTKINMQIIISTILKDLTVNLILGKKLIMY